MDDASALDAGIAEDGMSAVEALVDEHYGAMHRLARLVGGDPERARRAVRDAFAIALAMPDRRPAGASMRGWFLRLVLGELAAASAPPEAPVSPAPPADFEREGSRWAGWWKDDLPPTPALELQALDDAISALPPAVAAVLILRDVEGLGEAEVETLLGHGRERQIALLHHGRTGLRTAIRATA